MHPVLLIKVIYEELVRFKQSHSRYWWRFPTRICAGHNHSMLWWKEDFLQRHYSRNLLFVERKLFFFRREPMCFYQFAFCLLKVVHHIYLFQKNQVPVDNLMLLLFRSEKHSRTLWDLFGLVLIRCL